MFLWPVRRFRCSVLVSSPAAPRPSSMKRLDLRQRRLAADRLALEQIEDKVIHRHNTEEARLIVRWWRYDEGRLGFFKVSASEPHGCPNRAICGVVVATLVVHEGGDGASLNDPRSLGIVSGRPGCSLTGVETIRQSQTPKWRRTLAVTCCTTSSVSRPYDQSTEPALKTLPLPRVK
ncbi:MAG: hypothetical protein ACI88C_000418 [Acidimicrobiales bacterium]